MVFPLENIFGIFTESISGGLCWLYVHVIKVCLKGGHQLSLRDVVVPESHCWKLAQLGQTLEYNMPVFANICLELAIL